MPIRTAGRVLAAVEVPYLSQWQRQSAYVARSNALRATTELQERRREREDVEDFLESLRQERRAAAMRAAAARRAGRR